MNWSERIEKARKSGFTIDDRRDVQKWNTCAIGERFQLKRDIYDPQASEGEIDQAKQLGWDFQEAVLSNDIGKAIALYREIMALPDTLANKGKQP